MISSGQGSHHPLSLLLSKLASFSPRCSPIVTKRITNSSGLPASQESHTGEREHFRGHSHWSTLSHVGVPGPITEADMGSFISDWSDLVLCLLLVGDGGVMELWGLRPGKGSFLHWQTRGVGLCGDAVYGFISIVLRWWLWLCHLTRKKRRGILNRQNQHKTPV